MKNHQAPRHIITFVALCFTVMMATTSGFSDDMNDDPGAEAFLKHCMRCHTGILTGNDLQNTVLSTTGSLDKTVRRMEQQHTAPLTEKQIADLVELLHDREVKFRLEEAELMQDAPEDNQNPSASPDSPLDFSAKLFVKNCAACHTVGAGSSFGGDLAHTSTWPVERLRGDISRMQTRVGTMSDEQIDGLVKLLQVPDRQARLVSAGYKPAAVVTPAPRLTFKEQSAQIARARAEAARQKFAASGQAHQPTPQQPPFTVLFASLTIAAISGFAVYRLSKNAD